MQTKNKEVSHASIQRKKPDWEKIKSEYIAGTSMRELSRKYGLAVSGISKMAKKHGWQRRSEHVDKISEQIAIQSEQMMIEKAAEVISDVSVMFTQAVNLMAKKAYEGIGQVKPGDSRAMKEYMSIIKDLKEVGGFTTDIGAQNIEISFKDSEGDYGD